MPGYATSYKTCRYRALSFTGQFSGYVGGWSTSHPPVLKTNSYSLDLSCAWFTPSMLTLSCAASQTGITASLYSGLGDTDSDSDPTPINSRTLVSGSWEIEIDRVDEWVEITETTPPAAYGGAGVTDDPLGETTVEFWEEAPVGALVTVTLTIGSVTVSAVRTLTSAIRVTGYTIAGEVVAGGMRSPQDFDLEWDYHKHSIASGVSGSGSNASVSISGNTISVTTEPSGTGTGEATFGGRPPLGFELEGVLRSDAGAYTGGGTVRVKRQAGEDYGEVSAGTGSYSMSKTQLEYTAAYRFGSGSFTGTTVSEQTSPIYHWLVPPTGENSNQWRLLIRGAYYDVGTIVQAETVAIDGGFSFGDTGTTRTFMPAKSFAGYRYVLVQTDKASSPVRLSIGVKEWTVTTTAAGLAIFDLCAPHNLATDTDARDSRWPTPTDVDTVGGDGCMWGVANVSSLDLQADTGVTCTVPANGVKLSRDTWSDPAGHSLLNIATPHLYWVASGAANTYKRPFMRGDTDGRRSLDEADYTRVVGVPIIMTPETIEELLDAVNASDSGVVRNPGWTCTIDAGIDVADGSAGTDWDPNLLNRNRYASWVEGGGIAYVAGEWRYPLDRDVSSAQTLVAQVLCDKVKIYPMCGDVFGLRTGADRWAYGATSEAGRAVIRGGRYMRAAAWGLVLDTSGGPMAGATVTQSEVADGSGAGSGTSDIRGEYLTGAPYGRAGIEHRIEPNVGAGGAYIDRTVYGGTRLRSCFTAAPSSLGCIECDGPRAWLHVGHGKRIRTYHLWGWEIAGESSEYAVASWLRLRTDPRTGQLLMLSNDGGGTLGLWYSTDGGMTAVEGQTVTATSAAIEVDSERGAYVSIWENGGNVQVQISRDGGQNWSAAVSAQYLGSAFSGTIVDMARDARRDVMLLAIDQGGTIRVLGSRDLGLTWELVAS